MYSEVSGFVVLLARISMILVRKVDSFNCGL